MVATFAAYDRPNYHHLIPQHIADIRLQMLTDILTCLQGGSFTVSVTGRAFHDVAFNEAHEMLINKDLKRAIVRPSCEHLSQMSSFYQHRSACLHNLIHQVLPPKEQEKYQLSRDRKERENIESMVEAIRTGELLPPTTKSPTLRNTFNGKVAARDQRQDLLSFRDVGQKEYERYLTHTFIQDPSSKLITHQHKLKTFSAPKVTKNSMVEKQLLQTLMETLLSTMLLCKATLVFSNISL